MAPLVQERRRQPDFRAHAQLAFHRPLLRALANKPYQFWLVPHGLDLACRRKFCGRTLRSRSRPGNWRTGLEAIIQQVLNTSVDYTYAYRNPPAIAEYIQATGREYLQHMPVALLEKAPPWSLKLPVMRGDSQMAVEKPSTSTPPTIPPRIPGELAWKWRVPGKPGKNQAVSNQAGAVLASW